MEESGQHEFMADKRREILAAYPLGTPEIADELDKLAGLAARICDAPIGLVSVVGEDCQHFIGRTGTQLRSTEREVSFCAHAMMEADGMIVPDATRDPGFRDNPLVTADPRIRFYAGVPLRSPEGVPLGSLCVIDTRPREGLDSEQLDTLRTLARATMALLDRLRAEAASKALEKSSRAAIDEHEARFNLLADAVPQLVWSTDERGMVDYLNAGWCDFVGKPAQASFGTRWMQFLHHDDMPATRSAWEEAVELARPYEVEYRLRNAAGEFRWMLARGIPMLGQDGKAQRWFGTCTDIHEQKLSTDLLSLFSHELKHRIKNIFAVIGGLVAMTVRRNPQFAGVGKELQGRILALGRAHDFVRPQSGSRPGAESHSSLKDMLSVLLAPYGDNQTPRFTVDGPDLPIDDRSATPLALFFHELATNAAKYGALSGARGAVRIGIDRPAPDIVELTWEETGGPCVTAPETGGFGASLIEMSIVRQLGGEVEYGWRPAGLRVCARVPASAMNRQG